MIISFKKSKNPSLAIVIPHIVSVGVRDVQTGGSVCQFINTTPTLFIETISHNVNQVEFESRTDRDRAYKNTIAAIEKYYGTAGANHV